MGKRANGEGTIFQRKDGRWQGQVSLPGSGLERPQRATFYGKTQAETLGKMRDARDRAQRGDTTPTRSMTINDYRGHWLDGTKRDEVTRGHNRETTLRNYGDLWDRHIGPDLGHLRLIELTPTLLRRWAAEKAQTLSARNKPLSASTQVRIYGVLRNALNDAVNDGLLASNPLLKVKPPRGAAKRADPLKPAEVTALLRACQGDQLFTLVFLMLLTGARPGEALAASWDDLDLAEGRWFISRSLTRQPTEPGGRQTSLQFSRTKTPRSAATITLPGLLVTELKRHRAQQAQARMAAAVWLDASLVFSTNLGTPLEARNVRRQLARAAASAGLGRQVRLHDLRHSAASALLAEGVDIAVTSKLLRHTRLATTSDIYSHLLEEVETEAARVMDARMRRLLLP